MSPRRVIALCVFALIVSSCAISMVGCNLTPQDRVAAVQSAIEQGRDVSARLDASLIDLESVLTEALAQAAAAPAEEAVQVREVIEQASQRIAEVRQRKQQVDALIERWQRQLEAVLRDGKVTSADELTLAGGAARDLSGVLPSPLNWIAWGISAVMTLAAGVAARRAQQKQVAVEELVNGVDLVLVKQQTFADDIKATLKTAQSPETRVLVDSLRATPA